MPWFELKILKRSPDGMLVGRPSDVQMFAAANIAEAKGEADRRARKLGAGSIGLLHDAKGAQLGAYDAGAGADEPAS
jgi:hypothetical protein